MKLPTHQPAVYQLRLPREHLTLYAPVPALPALTVYARARGQDTRPYYLLRVFLSRKTRDLLVGVSTVPYCKNGER